MSLRVILTMGALALPGAINAQTLVAARSLPAQTLIEPSDLTVIPSETAQAMTSAEEAIGRETRIAIHAGRAIFARDIGAPTLVARNARVVLVYRKAGLVIRTEGRALGRGAAGDEIRVMNLTSKNTVTGVIGQDGAVHVDG